MRSLYGHGRPLRLAIYAACLSAFLFFGYNQGVMGGILPNENFKAQFDHPSDTLTGIIVSSYCLGALVGCGFTFFFGDHYGRRRMIWAAMAFLAVGAALQASAYSLPHILVGRIFTGIGTGIDSATVPMYQSELCKKEHRGRLVSQEVLFINIGVLMSIDFGFSYLPGSVAWRVPIALQLIFVVIVTVIVWGLPESPRWLAKRGREDEAVEVLCAVFELGPTDPYIVDELNGIREAISIESESGEQTFSSLFKKDSVKTRRRIAISWFVLFIDQLCGINMLVVYMPTILVGNVGQTTKDAQITSGCVQIALVVGVLLPAWRLDKMGRRRTLLYGSAALGLCFMFISILLSFDEKRKSEAAIAFFGLWLLLFGATICAVPWVYSPEILPLHARARGTAIRISPDCGDCDGERRCRGRNSMPG